jgi:hypothetical protein
MTNKIGGAIWLTKKELDILSSIIGFVEAGEVDGGPLDDESARVVNQNILAFNRLKEKVARA